MFEWVDQASDAMMSGVVSALGLIGLGDEPPSHIDLDRLLVGFDEQCRVSSELESLWHSVVRGETIVLPEDYRPYFSDIEVQVEDEYRDIKLPVKGRWYGFDVVNLTFIAGIDNGISLISVHFANEQPELAATFLPLAQVSAEALGTDAENYSMITTDFGTFSGVTQFFCDFST